MESYKEINLKIIYLYHPLMRSKLFKIDGLF